MRKSRRKFNFEFKKMIVELAESGQYSINQIARDHEIAPGLITQWRQKIQAGELTQGPSWREKQLETELEKSHRKIGELTLIIDALKKGMDHIQQQRKSNSSIISPRTLARSEVPAK
jgi:transposase